jgi:membrane protease YdiL (CAAX protease family)
MIQPGLIEHVLFFFIGVVLPVLALISGKLQSGEYDQEDLPPKKHLFYTNALVLWIAALIVLTAVHYTRQDFSLMGFKLPVWNSEVYFFLAVFLLFYLGDILSGFLIPGLKKSRIEKFKDLKPIIPLNTQEYGHYSFLAFSAGVCEEFVYRGFLIPYLMSLFISFENPHYYAVAFQALIFSLSHMYQGKSAVYKIFFLSVLFGFIFLYSGSLLIVVILHVAVDLISGWSYMYFAKKQGLDI